MSALYIERSLTPTIARAAREFPVVILTGPRQSGKTTLLRRVFGSSHRYVSLELPDVQQAARSDPRGFLRLNGPPAIYDEVQNAPELLHYIKERVDAHRDQPGQFVLSGSQNLLVLQSVTQTLAGRAAVLRLLPLSLREILGWPDAPPAWESRTIEPGARRELPLPALWELMLRGGYPELHRPGDRDLQLWHASYVQTYLERDVRSLRQVGDLSEFQRFLRLLAARSAGVLNMSGLSRDLGVALNTVKAWISVLEATHQITLLRPYHANIGKRLIKAPKVYLCDVGTLCYLVGLRDARHAMHGPMAGAIMETAVLAEIQRTLIHLGREPRVFFFRTAGGIEVDLIIERSAGELIPIEVKLTATPRPGDAAGIGALRSLLGAEVKEGYVVHPGDQQLPLGERVTALPFALL